MPLTPDPGPLIPGLSPRRGGGPGRLTGRCSLTSALRGPSGSGPGRAADEGLSPGPRVQEPSRAEARGGN